ncbi:MAG: phosphatidate cytidylyltransferase [Tissierellia bacterium]|nr:phosphatidate cytidylyltransferase [Tissierellia bacterium]
MKEIEKRAITGIILVIVVFLMLFFKGMTLGVGMFILASIALFEWNKYLVSPKKTSLVLDIIWLAFFFFYTKNSLEAMVAITIPGICIILISSIMLHHSYNSIVNRVFAIFYIAWSFKLLMILGQEGIWAWMVFALSFGSDTFAYLAGVTFGKRPLAPTISPKKSVEGSIGGIIGSIIIAIILGKFFINISFIWSVATGLLASVMAQLGDLFASLVKRSVSIKDFGNILLGHGGVLDRFDSILLVGPLVYAIVYFLS